ncbi:MAG: sigma factor, partial [Planctomycetota bacterium]
MHTDYLNPVIQELRDQQVRSASRQEKIRCVERAEKLLDEVNTQETYACEYLHAQITGSQPPNGRRLQVPGHAVRHDLRLFVEDVSEAADVAADGMGEQVLTIGQLARKFNVSTKTISRWRQRGLIGRRFAIDGRKRIGFLQSAVDRFVAQNSERVRRGGSFSQLTQEERTRIIDRARSLAEAGGWPADVTKSLARETGRSIETIRYTLRQFDRKRPDAAIFPHSHGPLTWETKKRIYQQHRRGDSVDALAKRFCRTKTGIGRVLREVRARRIMDLPLDYVANPLFESIASSKEERGICGPTPKGNKPVAKPRLPSGLPPYLRSLYEVPLLTREQEVHLFRKMNYLKCKTVKLREMLDPERLQRRLMSRIERLYEEILATKNEIIRANLRLVVSIAKRHVGPTTSLFELVSDGNISLIRVVEKFDFVKGKKLSSYVSWVIM